MNGSDLDDLCQWVNSKRTFCCDKETTIENLLEPIETKDSTPISRDAMAQSLVDVYENVSESSHDIPIGIVEDKQTYQVMLLFHLLDLPLSIHLI